MTRLNWDQRRYESGISNGVLYVEDDPGVNWNGLIAIRESPVGGESTPLYYDGIKYLDYKANSFFQATIEAYSTPPEFAPCNGERPVISGFYLTRQPRSRFGLSYKTYINNTDYKIHLIYNAIAIPTKIGYQTKDNTSKASGFAWVIDAVPPLSSKFKPSAHFVVDSSKINSDRISVLEDYLYGTDDTFPALPTPDTIFNILNDTLGLDVISEPIAEPI